MYIFNENYQKIIKKLPEKSFKATLYLLLASCWGVILLGTFMLVS
tara:strand:+ start:146 stop:280 length:135 start_codon:yes stop_codon:yes gene_type:complete